MKKIWAGLVLFLSLVLGVSGCGLEDELIDIAGEVLLEAADLEENEEAGDAESGDSDTQELIDRDGSYTSPEDVALYIHTYGELPQNFITKRDAEALGWVSKEGNLDEVAPGMSIGGDRFGNYENLLPKGKYKECDVNYSGGYRGEERLIYDEEGNIYYTDDHYASFTQLYESEE